MKKKCIRNLCHLLLLVFSCHSIQVQEIVIGADNSDGIIITTSSSSNQISGKHTTSSQGFLPNPNASSRFLSQASYGGRYEDIQELTQLGSYDWIDQQIVSLRPFSVMDKVLEFETINPNPSNFEMAWWKYTMTSPDVLRQKIALALGEIFVISKVSKFDQYAYAFGSFYDILADHLFGNYHDLLEDVTHHTTMGRYLT